MEWPVWLCLGPSLAVVGVVLLIRISAGCFHLVKVARAGRLVRDIITPILWVVGVIAIAPLGVTVFFIWLVWTFISDESIFI